MKKNLPLIVLVVLCLSLVLVACQKPAPSENTLSVPLVGNNTASSDGKDTYPAGGETENTSAQSPDVNQTYPIKENNPNFDAEMEAWVKQLFGDKHTLEFVLSQKKSAEEWRTLLEGPAHEHLMLSETQLTLLIDWLLEKTK